MHYGLRNLNSYERASNQLRLAKSTLPSGNSARDDNVEFIQWKSRASRKRISRALIIANVETFALQSATRLSTPSSQRNCASLSHASNKSYLQSAVTTAAKSRQLPTFVLRTMSANRSRIDSLRVCQDSLQVRSGISASQDVISLPEGCSNRHKPRLQLQGLDLNASPKVRSRARARQGWQKRNWSTFISVRMVK